MDVALFGETVAAVDGKALEIVVEQDVDHAADRVRTVNGRSAVLEDFDALDERGREKVHVLERCTATRERGGIRDAATVEQHQRGQAAQATSEPPFVLPEPMLALVEPRLPPPVNAGSDAAKAICGSSDPVRPTAAWSSVVTGAAPTSDADGMLEPVTTTRSASWVSPVGAPGLPAPEVCAWTAPSATSELPSPMDNAHREVGIFFPSKVLIILCVCICGG